MDEGPKRIEKAGFSKIPVCVCGRSLSDNVHKKKGGKYIVFFCFLFVLMRELNPKLRKADTKVHAFMFWCQYTLNMKITSRRQIELLC